MIAAEYIARFVPKAGPTPVALPMPEPETTRRVVTARTSPDFARVLAVCQPCLSYAIAGKSCTACQTCGGGSVTLLWASRRGCPLSKWSAA